MKTFAVWEDDCADEGSTLIDAETPKGAKRRYRRMTGERVPRPELSELSASLMTLELLAQRRLLNGDDS